ncbi:hypothetical protein BD289DRAFT_15564 [Coniella lustricola]|uniref:Clr5 domain-containing protein n=1 Tax=Coniella lustricola TaxID=2025994 RepID=A0A2T3A403_9PEZI|nr:hypothetical protein BD289DRAFT_15564 [Coniella lustricola]
MDFQGSEHFGDFHFSVSEPSPLGSEAASQLHEPRTLACLSYAHDLSAIIPSSEDGSLLGLAPQTLYHHTESDTSLDRDATLSTSPPGSVEGSRRHVNPSEEQWKQYRELITRLYWEDNLPMPAVREYMGSEHGFHATARAYKFRFKKWGLRKNIKGHEARELVSGSKNPRDFWAGSKGLNFERRIARHMEKTREGRSSRHSSRPRSPHALDVTINSSHQQPQRRPSAAGPYEAMLTAKHYWEIWVTRSSHSFGSICLKEDASLEQSLADESISTFFSLFERSLVALSCDQETNRAFADVDQSFTYLNGLMTLRHPFIHIRILSLAVGYRRFPHVEVCYRVCCLLLDYCLGLLRTLYGQGDPVCRLWSAITDMLQAKEEPQYYDQFLESICGTWSTVWTQTQGYLDLGSVRLEAYITSPQRCQYETTLRRHLADPAAATDDTLTPAAQESRLALAELLINQGRILEAQPVLADVQRYKLFDFVDPESKGFWLSELMWRAGNPQRSVQVLQEVLEKLDSRPTTDHTGPPTVSSLQVLVLLYHRQTMLLSPGGARSLKTRIAESLANHTTTQKTPSSPTLLHLAACDYEIQIGSRSGPHISWRPSP